MLLVIAMLLVAILLLSVRIIFSRHHSFLRGHACHGQRERQGKTEL